MCIRDRDYTAEGLAESGIRAALIARDDFDGLIATSTEFRRFVFAAYSRRITDLFTVIEEVAFRRMDVRLAALLAERAVAGRVLGTHQSIAAELGTAREVVSRSLRDFVRKGWVSTERGAVILLDPDALARFGAG